MRWFFLLIVSASVVWAQQFTNGPWTYTLNLSNEATITGYGGLGGAVEIPSILGGSPVRQIGNGWPPVFRTGSSWFNASVTSVAIPSGITRIGNGAFAHCQNLTNVVIPTGVTSIDDYGFYATSLTAIAIPHGVTNIGNHAFQAHPSVPSLLSSVSIPDSVLSVGSFAFESCTALSTATFGNGLLSIGEYAFSSCKLLASVEIPDSVAIVGSGAFALCSSLTNLDIGTGVRNIETGAFRECLSLTTVQIPEGVTSIGIEAFYSCTGLTSVMVPNSVRSIGDNSFGACSALTNATLPSRFVADLSRIGFSGELATDLMVKGIAERIVAALPQNYHIATKADLGTAVSNAVTQTVSQVQASPSDYNLFTHVQNEARYNEGVTVGTSTVMANPSSYSLYDSTSIMDLRMGGLMIQKQGTDATVVFQPQTTTDLVTVPFTNNGTPITNAIPMPGDKGFLRVEAIYVPAGDLINSPPSGN